MAAAPPGWTGPFALYDGPPAGDPGCPVAFPVQDYTGNGQFSAPAAVCSACMCGNPLGETCQVTGPADITFAGTIDPFSVVDTTCGGSPSCGATLEVIPTWNGTCYGPDHVPPGVVTCGPNSNNCTTGTTVCNQSAQATPLQVSGGTCTPSTEVSTIAQVAWGTYGDACGGEAMATKGCGAMHLCLPRPGAPFQITLCIQKGGDNACVGAFTKKHLFYASASDTRACTGCACGTPAGSTCSATVTLYSTPGCNAGTSVATLHPTSQAGDCKPLAANPYVGGRQAVFTAPVGGTCPPSGGQPVGVATPQSPTTFCCQ